MWLRPLATRRSSNAPGLVSAATNEIEQKRETSERRMQVCMKNDATGQDARGQSEVDAVLSADDACHRSRRAANQFSEKPA
jgi:hypothetical protein